MDDLLSIAVSNAVAAAVLGLVAIAVSAVYRRPALVHGLWLLVLLKLVTPPLVFIPVAWPTAAQSPSLEVAAIQEKPTIAPSGRSNTARLTLQPQEQEELVAVVPAGEDEVLDAEAPAAVEEPSIPSPVASTAAPLWPQILRIVWGVGALAWFVLVLERLHHFRRLLRFARPAPAALQQRTRRLAEALGLKYCPRVRLLPGRIAPMLWAIGGPPRLLVPADLLDVLSDKQLDTLLVHELAHLRRRDHWVRVLEFVVMGLYWWHPVVWYARRELREAEEQCCDAWVVSTLPDTGRTYASALLDTLDFLSTAQVAVPPLASGLGQIADLKRRLTMIMQGNTPRSLTWPGCLAVVALGLAVLPMLPSLYGEPPREEEARDQIREAEKALEKAKAALERQKTELDQKVKELIRAEQRLASESVRSARVQLEKAQPQVTRGRVVKTATHRIEITLPVEEGVDANEIVQKIRKALPEELRNKIVIQSHAENGYRIQIGQAPPAATTPPQPPQPPRAAPRSQPPVAEFQKDPNERPSTSSEKRINDLERKLEKVLRELQELRKQMKQPRGGNYSAPEPVPPGQPPAPPATTPVPPAPPAAATPKPPSRRNRYDAPTVPLAPSVEPPPPAATPPAPPAENSAPQPGPSARRLPNPYGEYRFS